MSMTEMHAMSIIYHYVSMRQSSTHILSHVPQRSLFVSTVVVKRMIDCQDERFCKVWGNW